MSPKNNPAASPQGDKAPGTPGNATPDKNQPTTPATPSKANAAVLLPPPLQCHAR